MPENTLLEEIVSSNPYKARCFTFETQSDDTLWKVLLGDLGLLIIEHKLGPKMEKLFIANPNFAQLYREFDSLRVQLSANELEATEPVLCWLRGLLHAFIAENPNPVLCSVVMTKMSSPKV